MATRDLPDIYALPQGRGHIYQANPEWPWYKQYMLLRYALLQEYMTVGHSPVYILQSNACIIV